MTTLHAGTTIRLSSTGELLTIWSPAHLPGCYWAHKTNSNTQRAYLIRVRHTKTDPYPIVTLVEE